MDLVSIELIYYGRSQPTTFVLLPIESMIIDQYLLSVLFLCGFFSKFVQNIWYCKAYNNFV